MVAPITITHLFNGDANAANLVDAAQLDTQFANIVNNQTAEIIERQKVVKDGGQLADQVVRYRSLHPEVLTSLSGIIFLQVAAVTSTSAIALSGLQTIDGYLTVAGDRVLVNGQADQTTNGVYVAAAGAWARASDATGVLTTASAIGVANGTAYTNSTWSLIANATLGSTANSWKLIQTGAKVSPAMQDVTLAASHAAGRLALGISAAVDPVVTALTLPLARAALGISAAMDPVVNASTLALARAAMGPWGDAVYTSASGSTLRSLAARADEEINVLDQGVKNDGSTDNSSAIYIAALNAAALGKGLYFPPGVYNTLAIAQLPATLKSIRGAGPSTIIRATGTFSVGQFVFGTFNAPNICISDMEIRIDPANTNAIAVQFNQSDRFTARNLILTSARYGVFAINCNGGRIANSSIAQWINSGIYLFQCTNVTVANVDVVGPTGGGGNAIYVDTCLFCTVEGCFVNGSLGFGISLRTSSECIVSGNFVYRTTLEGIQGYNSNYNVISCNLIYQTGGPSTDYGMSLWGDSGVSGTCYGNLIANNIITGSAASGLALDDSVNLTKVIGNTIFNCNQTRVDALGAGIFIYGTNGGGCKICDNTISDVTGKHKYAINEASSAGAPANEIYDNYVSGAITALIATTVTGTKIRTNFGFATRTSGTASITAAITSIVVNHGLARTPTASGITVTPTTDISTAARFWFDTITATQFTIRVNAAPGATIGFAWAATVEA